VVAVAVVASTLRLVVLVELVVLVLLFLDTQALLQLQSELV
jgi:hypothetical protein